jgi:hypothetical protein
MAGRTTALTSKRLASGAQLWRMNQLGLGPFAGHEPVTAEQAKRLIGDELASYGLQTFPKAGETWPERLDTAA